MQTSTTPFRLDGKRALVTGGASGIGESTCRVLASAGASVIIADIDQPRAEALSRQLAGSTVLRLDITDEAAVGQAFSRLGELDILINNAGIGLVGSIEETALDDFQRLFRVNVEGMYIVTKAAIPKLLASKGAIVNIGSVAGLVGLKRRFAYCATKGAVVALSRQLALDYAGRVRVNCVCPGTVDTPFVDAYLKKFHAHEIEKTRAELHARQLVGRMGKPDEIAYMVLYLCSAEAEFVTGSTPTIDGGLTAA
jgi:NAD(P)-dependent dehydrogenase (short-subunit alcohol dehydrogenase family)